ncbi:MAG: hypothetical protein GY778_31415 [bacterium]|nr:hypothetical protein [bacterium]
MSAENFAAWIQEEHHRVDQLAHGLRGLIGAVPTTGLAAWIEEVGKRFEHIRAHLRKHMALEERDGYLATVLEVRPTLAGEVARLQHEHLELARLMDDIYRNLGQLTPEDRLLTRDVCQRIGNLLSYIAHHEADENLIVLSVFTDDIGTED